MRTGTVVVKNKENGTEKIFENVFDVTTDSDIFMIHNDVNKEWAHDKASYDYDWVVEQTPTKQDETYKLTQTIMQLEKENEKLKRVIVNMCKSAFGGE
jgi:hypothetical protein